MITLTILLQTGTLPTLASQLMRHLRLLVLWVPLPTSTDSPTYSDICRGAGDAFEFSIERGGIACEYPVNGVAAFLAVLVCVMAAEASAVGGAVEFGGEALAV